jgi:tetratricopeptide (TPR) repeat protein
MPQTINDLLRKGYTSWNQPETLLEVGMELESRSRLSEARTFLQRVIEIDSKNFPQAYVILAYSFMRDNNPEEGEIAFTNGIEETDSGYVKASYICILEDQTIEDQFVHWCSMQNDATVLMTLGASLIWKGRKKEALDFCRRGIQLVHPKSIPLGLSEYCFTMLWLFTNGENIDLSTEVTPYIQLLLEQNPQNYNYHNFQLIYHQNKQEWAEVVEYGKKMIEVFPDEETTMLAIAVAYVKLGDDQRAIHWLSRAIGSKPSFVRARRQLAAIYAKLEQIDLALEIMRQIPAANPSNGMGYLFTAGFIYKYSPDSKEEAEQIFKKGYSKLFEYEKGSLVNFEDFKPFQHLMK